MRRAVKWEKVLSEKAEGRTITTFYVCIIAGLRAAMQLLLFSGPPLR